MLLDYFAYGLFQQIPWWGYLLILLVFTQLTIFSVTLYLHRSQAHRSLDLSPLVSHVFRFWLWMSTGQVTKEWVAVHRKHHAKVETNEDPHSPVAKGIKQVLFRGAELYKEETHNLETLERYGQGAPDDWIERHLYTKHSMLGVSLMLLVNLLCFGMVGVTLWALQMAWIPFFAAGIINGVGHYWGYRNFESKDSSRNVVPFGIFLGGEELHNNHHAYATSAKLSAKWWEVDSGWMMIRLLQFFHLASPKRVVPKLKMSPNKTIIDTDTLKALITYRFQVMSRYTREVIAPALQEERKRASKAGQVLLRRARTVMARDASIMKVSQTTRLANVLENFHNLRVVYQFRLRLQDIWNRSTASQKELLEALQEWCQQAEATGIDALFHFAKRLKTYVPQ